jgi:hypothetical protein
MSFVPTYIENRVKLTETFGYWPRFHDSPVNSLTFANQKIDLIIQVWEMTSEIDDKGYFILKNHHLVHFRFDGISDISLKEPELGNILFELSFSELDDSHRFDVTLDSVMDRDCSFKAQKGTIIDVSPCDRHGSKTEQGAAANP